MRNLAEFDSTDPKLHAAAGVLFEASGIAHNNLPFKVTGVLFLAGAGVLHVLKRREVRRSRQAENQNKPPRE